jgi:enoyl-CoA hydratase/carnithine racemase
VPAGELLSTTERLAKQILSNGPGAVRLAKRVFCTEETSWLEKGLAGEAEAFGEAFLGEEAREGLKAFLEKRAPVWRGQYA